MKNKDKIHVREMIESEGFDYAIADLSDYQDIKDEGFHQLREEYLRVKDMLSSYIGLEE